MVLLEVDSLRVYYFTSKGVVKAVDNITLNLKRSESLGLAGESGCGKSTFGFSLLRLVPPPGRIVGGKIIYDGTNILEIDEETFRKNYRWKRIAMVFQGAMNALNPVRRIGDQIVEAILAHDENVDEEAAYKRAGDLLELVGIDRIRVKSYPHELSGGMKQRVVIAMALALSPELLIADEPTTALDVVVQAQIMNLLKELKNKLKMSLILITHDLAIIAEVADKVAVMYAGKIVEWGTSEQIFLSPKHPYTAGLVASIPKLRGDKTLYWIPGQPPDLINPPPGCRFYSRCAKRMDICSKEEPPMIEVEPEHYVACWLYAKR